MARNEKHEAGLKLFKERQYENAARELRTELESNPSSELWNDWAVAEASCGRIVEAMQGLSNAISLDPANNEALENLRQLREVPNRPTPFNILPESGFLPARSTRTDQPALDSSVQSASLDAATAGIVNAYFRTLAALPAHDPALSPEMREAFRRANSNSSYFVMEAYRLLLELPELATRAILSQWERQSQRGELDYRLLAVSALHAMDQHQWDRALRLLRTSADANWADIFVQRVRILCEHLRHEVEPEKSDTFAGLEDYLAGSFCSMPWESVEITSWGTEIEQTGDVYFCCPAWLPLVPGNAREQSTEQIWNSTVAKEVRKSILDGSFRYCSKVHCNLISGRTLPSREEATQAARSKAEPSACNLSLEQLYPLEMIKGPSKVVLSYDRSCNLACPSCRNDFYSAPKRQQEQMQRTYGEFVKNIAKDARLIHMDGAGETFASKHSREVLRSLNRKDYPALKFQLLTNGQLFDRRAYDEFDLRGRLERVDISIDAAVAETYEVIRKGGEFKRLIDNVAFLDSLRLQEGEDFTLTFRFVISALNYQEIPAVIRLGKQFHLDMVEFAMIRMWGQFSSEEARNLLISVPDHPQHLAFVEVLSAPELDDPIVNLGNALEFRRRAVLTDIHSH